MKNLFLTLLILWAVVPATAQNYYNKDEVSSLPHKVKKAYRRTSRYLDDAVKGDFKYTPPARSKIAKWN